MTFLNIKNFVHFYVPTHKNQTHPDLESPYLNPTRKFIIPEQNIISKPKKTQYPKKPIHTQPHIWYTYLNEVVKKYKNVKDIIKHLNIGKFCFIFL